MHSWTVKKQQTWNEECWVTDKPEDMAWVSIMKLIVQNMKRQGIVIGFIGDEGWFASGMEQEFRRSPTACVTVNKGVLSAELMLVSMVGAWGRARTLNTGRGTQWTYRRHWQKVNWVVYLAWKLRDSFLRGVTYSVKPKEWGRVGWGDPRGGVSQGQGTA